MSMDVGAKKGPRSDINITPLVDVVLVLLIIFMVLTPLMEKQIRAAVPEDLPPELTPPPDPNYLQVLFKVDETGLWHLNNETLTDSTAQDRLRAYYRSLKAKEATQGPPVIFFDADDKAKYVRAVKALDAIRDSSSGWTIGMMTSSIKAEAEQPAAAQPGATPAPGDANAPAQPATPAPPPPATPPPDQSGAPK
jgi:biopolymer transport protein ExbD